MQRNPSGFIIGLLSTLAMGAIAGMLPACSSKPSGSGCTRDNDCPSGQLCNLLAGTCVRDQSTIDVSRDQFVGDFSCTVATDVQTAAINGKSQVMGGFDGSLLRLTDPPTCLLTQTGLLVALSGARAVADAGSVVENFVLALATKAGGQANNLQFQVVPGYVRDADLGASDVSVQLFSELSGDTSMPFRAFGASGSISLSGNIVAGQHMTGTVNVLLAKVGGGALSASCKATGDCDINQGLVCLSNWGICLSTCAADADCQGLGGRCVLPQGLTKGFCFATCSDNTVCGGSSRCANLAGVGRVCAPRDFPAVDDPNWLGAPCTSATSCTSGVCAKASAAEDGFCTIPCTSTDDCVSYVGIQTSCQAVGGGQQICLQICSQSSECQPNAACGQGAGTKVCLPRPAGSTTVDGGSVADDGGLGDASGSGDASGGAGGASGDAGT